MVKDNEEKSEWGHDSIDMPELIPHFPEPPIGLRMKLKELGDKIHNRVKDLRMELFGDHGEVRKDIIGEGDGAPQMHVMRMHFPPFFPGFLKDDEWARILVELYKQKTYIIVWQCCETNEIKYEYLDNLSTSQHHQILKNYN